MRAQGHVLGAAEGPATRVCLLLREAAHPELPVGAHLVERARAGAATLAATLG